MNTGEPRPDIICDSWPEILVSLGGIEMGQKRLECVWELIKENVVLREWKALF